MANAFNYLTRANSASIYRRELMKEEYVLVKFSDTEKKKCAAGEGFTYEGMTFVLLEDYLPEYNSSTGAYDYSLRFDAWYYGMNQTLFKLAGEYSPEWSLTAPPSQFFKLIAENMQCEVKYKTTTKENGTEVAEADELIPFITCTFNGTGCLDALNMIVKQLDPEGGYFEWWAEGNTIHIGKLAENAAQTSALPLSLGTNLASIKSSKGTRQKIDKLYAFGSTRNISAQYGSTMQSINANTYTQGLGWQDPQHIMRPDMFSPSTRLANTITYTSESDTHRTLTPQWNHLVSIPMGTSGTATTGMAAIKGGNLELSITANNDGSGNWEETKVAVFLRLGTSRGGFQQRAPMGEWELQSRVENHTFSLPTEGAKIAMYADDPLTVSLEINCYIKSRGVWSQTGSGYPLIAVRSNTLQLRATSENYAILTDGPDGAELTMNPHFYPPNDPRAFYFDRTFNGIPRWIIKARTPYAWWPQADETSYGAAKLTKRLTVNDKGYITMKDVDSSYAGTIGEVEQQKIFEEIYPSVTATLGTCDIKSIEEEDSTGKKTGNLLNYYTFHTTNMRYISTDNFTEQEATINFMSGRLNGMTFKLRLVKSDASGTDFCIIPNEDYGRLLPNATLYPEATDTYTIVGIDISLYDDANLIAKARERLLNLAKAYLQLSQQDQSIYDASMICTALKFPKFGDAVILQDADNLRTRVIGVQHPIDVPAADYQITCGNALSYTRLGALENKTLSLK